MSVPTSETGLALAAVDFGDEYTKELGQVRVWAAPTVPTGGPENYLGVLESLLGRQRLDVTHGGGKDTDNRDPRKI